MRASDHTDSMLQSWMRMGIHFADLALRRSNGAMVWHRSCDLQSLSLSWAEWPRDRSDVWYPIAEDYEFDGSSFVVANF